MSLNTHQVQQALEEYYGEKLGLKGNADLLMQPGFNMPRACVEVIEEKTGIRVPSIQLRRGTLRL